MPIFAFYIWEKSAKQALAPLHHGIIMAIFKQTVVFEEGILPEKRRIRIAVSLFYFSLGLSFASWASRIPEIKTALHLSDAAFGSILFALPVGQFLMMTFSGRLVTRYGSRKMLLIALPVYTICLSNIGLVTQGWQLAIA